MLLALQPFPHVLQMPVPLLLLLLLLLLGLYISFWLGSICSSSPETQPLLQALLCLCVCFPMPLACLLPLQLLHWRLLLDENLLLLHACRRALQPRQRIPLLLLLLLL
jgi:hypothetical protein